MGIIRKSQGNRLFWSRPLQPMLRGESHSKDMGLGELTAPDAGQMTETAVC